MPLVKTITVFVRNAPLLPWCLKPAVCYITASRLGLERQNYPCLATTSIQRTSLLRSCLFLHRVGPCWLAAILVCSELRHDQLVSSLDIWLHKCMSKRAHTLTARLPQQGASPTVAHATLLTEANCDVSWCTNTHLEVPNE